MEDDSDDDSSGSEVGPNQFLRDVDSDSEDSEEEKREKVKSASTKRLEDLEASIKQIENGQKNGDWSLISAGMLADGDAIMASERRELMNMRP
jgi:translation initiation factor 3 subunit C